MCIKYYLLYIDIKKDRWDSRNPYRHTHCYSAYKDFTKPYPGKKNSIRAMPMHNLAFDNSRGITIRFVNVRLHISSQYQSHALPLRLLLIAA